MRAGRYLEAREAFQKIAPELLNEASPKISTTNYLISRGTANSPQPSSNENAALSRSTALPHIFSKPDRGRSKNTEGITMKSQWIVACVSLTLLGSASAFAGDKEATIASAESAGPAAVTANATIKALDGTVLRKGSNGYTCHPQQDAIGPMCNEPVWDALIGAMMKKEEFKSDQFSVSYMLAGEGTALGVSNSDPYATDPAKSDDWVKEGPHLMIVVPDRAMLENLSTDPNDPVYVMWKDTPYAHIMVKIGADGD
jgi:hypothetical protein